MRSYDPDSADGWALRQLIHGWPRPPARNGRRATPFVLVVLSMSGDPGGLAIGPRSPRSPHPHGIPTQLVAAQQHESATTLWVACARTPKAGASATLSRSPRPLTPRPRRRLGAPRRARPGRPRTRRRPAGGTRSARGELGVGHPPEPRRRRRRRGPGRAQVQGIIVANPDPLDRTTGRLAPLESPGPPRAATDPDHRPLRREGAARPERPAPAEHAGGSGEGARPGASSDEDGDPELTGTPPPLLASPVRALGDALRRTWRIWVGPRPRRCVCSGSAPSRPCPIRRRRRPPCSWCRPAPATSRP